MLQLRSGAAAALAVLLLCACGSGSGPAADAGRPDSLVDASTDAAPADAAAADLAAGVDATTAPETDAGPADVAAADTVADAVADASADTDAGPDSGFPAGRPALIPLDGQVLCPVRVDGGDPRWMVVDTGAVRTAAEETLLRHVVNGVGVATFDFDGGLVFEDYAVLAADLTEARDHIGAPLAGLVGQDLFARLWFGLDYRGSRVHVAATAPVAPPPGFAAGDALSLPYDLVQGMPVVTVRVGDREARLIADTGSGVTIVTESLIPADVLAAGVTGYVWYTSYGSDPATIVRLPSLELAGTSVPGTWAVVVPDEYHLSAVFEAIGLEVDGFLGYPVYRRFFVAVDGAAGRYELWPYASLDHIAADEWDRVGIEVRRDAAATVVDMVFAPSDAAAQGVRPGDVLVAVDDVAAAGLSLDDLRLRLRAAPGTVRRLELEREGAPLVLDVASDRLLPL